MDVDRMVVKEGEETKKGWFGRKSSKKSQTKNRHVSLPPGVKLAKTPGSPGSSEPYQVKEEDLKQPSTPIPESGATPSTSSPLGSPSPSTTPRPSDVSEEDIKVPKHAGFDLKAIQEVIANADPEASMVHAPVALTPRVRASTSMPLPHEPSDRPESVPLSMKPRDLDAVPEEERSASARPSRNRIASEPYVAGTNPFEQEEEEEDGGDIGTALGRPPIAGSSSVGLGISTPGGLDSAFSRSMSLDDPADSGSSYLGSGASNPFSTSSNRAVPSWRNGEPSAPAESAWSSNGNGTSLGYSNPFAESSSRLSSEAPPTLSFGGAQGSLWDSEPKASSAMDSAMLSSPFASPPGSASLPEDVLNPFGISYADIGTTTKKDDGWQPPPLTSKVAAADNIGSKGSKSKTNFANGSSFNISSNPWG